MPVRAAVAILITVTVLACGRDKADDAAKQQAAAPPPLRDTVTKTAAPATASKAAPAPGAAGTKAPAQTPPRTQPRGGGGAAGSGAASSMPSGTLRTVQIAAFTDAAGAEALKARLERDGVPAWTTTANVNGEEWTRVRVGAATTAAGVHALADKLQTRYKSPLWITMVENRSALPGDILTTTQEYAGRP